MDSESLRAFGVLFPNSLSVFFSAGLGNKQITTAVTVNSYGDGNPRYPPAGGRTPRLAAAGRDGARAGLPALSGSAGRMDAYMGGGGEGQQHAVCNGEEILFVCPRRASVDPAHSPFTRDRDK